MARELFINTVIIYMPLWNDYTITPHNVANCTWIRIHEFFAKCVTAYRKDMKNGLSDSESYLHDSYSTFPQFVTLSTRDVSVFFACYVAILQAFVINISQCLYNVTTNYVWFAPKRLTNKRRIDWVFLQHCLWPFHNVFTMSSTLVES